MSKEINENVGINLERAMKENGLCDYQVALLVGMERKAIANYRKGKSDIPISTAKKITDFLGITLDDLFEDNDRIPSRRGGCRFTDYTKGFNDALEMISDLKNRGIEPNDYIEKMYISRNKKRKVK